MKSAFVTISLFASILVSTPVLADQYTQLPDGPGRDVVIKDCSKCHSPEVVAMQSLDEAGWKDLVAQMQNNGATPTDEEIGVIVKYLTTAFPK